MLCVAAFSFATAGAIATRATRRYAALPACRRRPGRTILIQA